MIASDYYELLGVNQTATLTDIKTAFRRKALEAHPDQGGTDKAFRELKAAFEYLITHHEPTSVVEVSLDPFSDPDYQNRSFFAPEYDTIAEFERSVRAQGCPYCHGRGIITRLVLPEKGFVGLEERFCRCQVVK